MFPIRLSAWLARGNGIDARILHQVFPPEAEGGYIAGGNLPFGDLVGKGEPAQGSSNGLRTIHALN